MITSFVPHPFISMVYMGIITRCLCKIRIKETVLLFMKKLILGDILPGRISPKISVYSERFHLIGKIDCYDQAKKELIERKKKIKTIYDGYIFQLYGQYFALTEMGYPVEKLFLYSYDHNKKYSVQLPQEDIAMYRRFKDTVASVQSFSVENFIQTNREKCLHCIYEPLCDRSLV